jgi:hypothetical protein
MAVRSRSEQSEGCEDTAHGIGDRKIWYLEMTVAQ